MKKGFSPYKFGRIFHLVIGLISISFESKNEHNLVMFYSCLPFVLPCSVCCMNVKRTLTEIGFEKFHPDSLKKALLFSNNFHNHISSDLKKNIHFTYKQHLYAHHTIATGNEIGVTFDQEDHNTDYRLLPTTDRTTIKFSNYDAIITYLMAFTIYNYQKKNRQYYEIFFLSLKRLIPTFKFSLNLSSVSKLKHSFFNQQQKWKYFSHMEKEMEHLREANKLICNLNFF
jgi:hypothetical protein